MRDQDVSGVQLLFPVADAPQVDDDVIVEGAQVALAVVATDILQSRAETNSELLSTSLSYLLNLGIST